MKGLALAALAGVVVALAFSSSSATLTAPGIVRVTATTISDFTRAGDRFTVSLVYNRRITQAAIGSAIMRCDYVGRGGPLGDSSWLCNAVYSFPRGKITVAGLVKVRSYYVLAVTGGTGIYSNVSGELVGSTISTSPRVERLLFGLEI